MKTFFVPLILGFAATQVAAQEECTFPHLEAAEENGRLTHIFEDSCGMPYEVGYRLEGNTLHFPRGGEHTLPEVPQDEAERIFRETYGLVGEPEALIRTLW